MSSSNVPALQDGSSGGPQLEIVRILKSPDLQFAIGLIAMLMLMVIPLPPVMLDLLLSLSITLSFLVLLVSIYVTEPLQFSTFPTVLLLSTLFRLSLNIATTRSILLEGNSGQVSQVVEAFGDFVIGGNYFVGFVIFTILVIINFIVITKGAGRVAEVGARFTLDAMPGKQMAIDAELNAGLIERDEAKKRRTKIEKEADFYGSMDGASKFVRGDAIAGIIITLINIVMGLIIGVTQYNMSFDQAASVFTLLTVGDGLVSQIPALIISTAAGIVVTRASDENGLSEQLSQQLTLNPKALFICSGLLVFMGIIPGLPILPFFLLALGFFYVGRYAQRNAGVQAELKKKEETLEQTPSEGETLESLLQVDTLALEVGVDLIPLVDTNQDGEVLERIVSARKQFVQEMGMIIPMVIVRDNIQIKPNEYQIVLKGNVIGSGQIMLGHYLAMEPGEILDPLDGIQTKEPAFGLKALWIRSNQKDEANFRGYTVVNASTVIVTHLNKLVSDYAHLLLGRQEAQRLVDGIKETHPKVVEEVLGGDHMHLGDVVKVLQNLLKEDVSIRDLASIFECLADHCRNIQNPDVLTRYVRKELGRGIIKKYLSDNQTVLFCSIDRGVEDLLVSGLVQNDDGSTSLNLNPEILQNLLNKIAEELKKFELYGSPPLVLCGALIRWDLYKLIKHFIPGVAVMAIDEIPLDVKRESIGMVSL